jgi:hypothetical protein
VRVLAYVRVSTEEQNRPTAVLGSKRSEPPFGLSASGEDGRSLRSWRTPVTARKT